MLLGYASNWLIPPSIPRPISHHYGPALCPKDRPLWVASLGSCRPWVWPIKALEGDQRGRKERRRGVVLSSSLQILGCIFWQWVNPSRTVAPVSWSLLYGSSSVPGLQEWRLFLLFAPFDLAVITASHCCYFLGDRNSTSPLTLSIPLEIIPSLKSSEPSTVGLCFLPDLRIQTIDL